MLEYDNTYDSTILWTKCKFCVSVHNNNQTYFLNLEKSLIYEMVLQEQTSGMQNYDVLSGKRRAFNVY